MHMYKFMYVYMYGPPKEATSGQCGRLRPTVSAAVAHQVSP